MAGPITEVRAVQYANLPIEPPPFRAGPTAASGALVSITNADGITGWSPIHHYGEVPLAEVVRLLNSHIGATLMGRDPLLVEEAWGELRTRFARRGPGLMYAIGALDVALWDLRGKVLQQPVWRQCGGARSRVEAYVAFGAAGPTSTSAPDQRRYSVEELVQEARHLVAEGHRRLKTLVGRTTPWDAADDLRRIAAVREAVGPDVALILDGGAGMDLVDAVRLSRLCEPLDISMFEEPVVRNDPRLLRQLRQQTSIPIAANPVGFAPTYAEYIRTGAVDILQPNVISMGFTEALRVADMAHANGVRIANGNGFGPHNAQLQCGSAAGSSVEYHLKHLRVYSALFQDLFLPENGWLEIPDRPGFGLDPDPDVLAAYTVSQEETA